MAFRRGGTSAAVAAANADTHPTSREYRSAPVEGQPERGNPGTRLNTYPGRCLLCEQWVDAEQGGIMKNDEGKWKPVHFAGECPDPRTRETSPESAVVAEEERPGVRLQQSVVGGKVVFDGDYTIDLGDRHRTFRLSTQSVEDEDFMPGRQLIAYLSGADNETDYTRFGHIDERGNLRIWKKHQDNTALVADAKSFWADPHAENVVPAVRCYRCGHKLTVPASVYNGLGPDCAKKGF